MALCHLRGTAVLSAALSRLMGSSRASTAAVIRPTRTHDTQSAAARQPPFLFEAPVFPKPLLPTQAMIPVPLAAGTRFFRGCTDAHT